MKFFKKKKRNLNLTKSEVPKELPSLARDIIKKKEQEGAFKQEPAQEIVKEQPANISSSSEVVKSANVPVSDVMHVKKYSSFNFKTKNVDNKTYFSNILATISDETKDIETAEKFYKEGLMSKDMLSGMKKYWDDQKKNILFTSKEDSLREKLLANINYLQEREKLWQRHHLALIDEEEKIRMGEIDLKKMLKAFKDLCKRHISDKKEEKAKKVTKDKDISNIGSEKFFKLVDGRVLRNLRELVWAIESMDDITFHHHVSGGKNDFANWVRDVIGNRRMAYFLSQAKTKEELLRAIRK